MAAPEDRNSEENFGPLAEQLARPDTHSINEEKPTSYAAIGLVVVLLVIAIGLVLLPIGSDLERSSVESEPNPPSTLAQTAVQTEEETTYQEAVRTPNANDASERPWTDKQIADARQEAQSILAKLIESQKSLEQIRAEQWAPEELALVSSLAEQGDSLYQDRAFTESLDLYRSALSAAEALQASAAERALDYLRAGSESLEANLVSEAIDRLELATLIDPSLDDAQDLLNRARVRDEILILERDALRSMDAQEFEQARGNYLSIQNLDDTYADIDLKIAGVAAEIQERDYRTAMSNGFAQLAGGDLTAAQRSFDQAEKIKPRTSAVQEALQQVEASRINNARQSDLDNATALEAAERWSEALAIYEKLAVEDATLTAARLGKLRTEARAGLNTQIQAILAEPLKLQSDTAWEQGNTVLVEARNIINRGPILSAQIDDLGEVLKRARTRVTVELYSDSETNVEIYRVGDLGEFREQAVSLFPGKYTLVGTRSGYRDVREELILDGTAQTVTITVQCEEAI